ncbi:MAG: superoxide dismutase family protein [Actinomycetota bacterium]|nr:superoxide dismutase family protein [Actinomycetota bacterium]
MSLRSSRTRILLVVAALTVGAAILSAAPNAGAHRKHLRATVRNTGGATVGHINFTDDDGAVLVKARFRGLAPGFHGFHIHSIGVCDPSAKDPTGATVPFFSAGGHYNPEASVHGSHAGDMPPVLVLQDGTAKLRFRTDRFGLDELIDDNGSAVVLHAGPDNLGHIPAATPTGGERYHSHLENVFGPDSLTRATGDAGARFGCALVESHES